MNAVARLVFSARKFEHITPLLHDLHWLRVPQRIEFKLAVLVYRCLHGTLHASCAVWQTSTHDDDCAPHRHMRSKCHRRVMLPSAIVPLASPLRVYETLCRPTSRHRHHCLSSSNISKPSYSQTLTRDIVINCLTSVKCSRSFF